ncbi:MAG TPA: MlaD family protein [Gemmatimonadaceae bacterium]|nr:MlaD family protein [Gemmatimonadaceae bacterium]
MKHDDPRLSIAAFLGATVLVLAGLVAYARNPSLFARGREYSAAFRSVAGLNAGDEVRYGGLPVGSVTAIDIDTADATRIVVRFRIRKKVPIRIDTRASITQVGLLGEPFLNLRAGSRTAPQLAVGGTLPSEENLSFQDAMTELARFFEHTDTIFGGLQRFASTNPWERLDRTITHFDQLVTTASRSSDKVMTRLDTASYQISRVLDHTDRLIASLDSAVNSAGPGFNSTQREALATLRETRSLVSDVREAMQQGGGVDQLMRNLAVATDNLARLSARLERDPTSVLKKRELPRKTVGPAIRD